MKTSRDERVMVVDDEPSNVALLTAVLKTAGYEQITSTADPREALVLFETLPPDIVLVDLLMPHMDGIELMGRLRELPGAESVPMMVLTADASPETKQTALTSGANDFLTKPFQHLEVLARVANLLETRRLHLELARHSEKLEEEVSARTKELRETEGRLFQSQKMDAVGQLAGGIAHDFNNLLAVIINYAILLLEDMDPDDPQREDVSEIQRAGESAATLTRQLLAFSRKEVVRSVVLDLNKVVRGVEKLLHRTIGENIEFVVDLDDVHPTKLDPGQMEQVLLNLAVNARDAMPDGGKLVIKTFDGTIDESYAAHHPGAYVGTYACIQVTDTGMGMTDAVKARVFEPFFTTKERGVGTGLGLATVYGVVKQAGGYIDVQSVVGSGTTVTIYFPVTTETAADDDGPIAAAPARGHGETILVAEDADGLRHLIERLLTRNGFQVLPAERGDRALELAERHSDRIDLLLTDVIMPGMSGKALGDAIRSMHAGVPIVYMSGYTDQVLSKDNTLRDEALLIKPFTEPELIQTIDDALRASRAQRGR